MWNIGINVEYVKLCISTYHQCGVGVQHKKKINISKMITRVIIT